MSYGIDGKGGSGRVRVNTEIILERMNVHMMQFFEEQLLPEIQGSMEAACKDVLRVEVWQEKIAYQLCQGIQKMMDECIKASVENNWALRQQLTYLMGEEMHKGLAHILSNR